MSKPPLHIAITHQPKTPSVTDTHNRPPLWEVMQRARDAVIATHHPFAREELCLAAEIRALRDEVVPEEQAPKLPEREDLIAPKLWKDRQRLRALLTAEAYRAERGDV